MYEIISGALKMGCATLGLFFFKFWRKSDERIFIIYAFAFWMLALERFVLAYIGGNNEPSIQIYLIRLAAFLLIFYGIIDKNKQQN